MRKQMIENAAYEVATQVRAVEDSIDAALAELAELQARDGAGQVGRRRRLRRRSMPPSRNSPAPLSGLVARARRDRRLPRRAGRSQGQGAGPAHGRLRRRGRLPADRRRSADLRVVA